MYTLLIHSMKMILPVSKKLFGLDQFHTIIDLLVVRQAFPTKSL